MNDSIPIIENYKDGLDGIVGKVQFAINENPSAKIAYEMLKQGVYKFELVTEENPNTGEREILYLTMIPDIKEENDGKKTLPEQK